MILLKNTPPIEKSIKNIEPRTLPFCLISNLEKESTYSKITILIKLKNIFIKMVFI